MATASKAPAALTPKNAPAAAPTPSPRPMGRPFSHKSPAIKTPASIHGHSYNVSTSSHPSSTPLPVPALGEDALVYSSPAAALIASIGSQGLTPLPSGQDGLGISAKSHAFSAKEGSVGSTRNMEEEKLRNVQEAQRLLKTRLASRAICREGVQRIAQHSNLTFAWLDDTNLSIAGNCVDLEIVFDDVQRDTVKDVVLKINTSGVEEHKRDASAVLQQDLHPTDFDASAAPWKSLEAFSANLNHLAHLDHLSNGLNCFEAVEGLYYSFQRIWAEEKKKRIQDKHVWRQIREATLGRPAMHAKRKLGLSLDYWVEGGQIGKAQSQQSGPDAMEVDQANTDLDKDEPASFTWLSRIGCETGYPSIRVSKDWVAEEVFSANDIDNESADAAAENRKLLWLDPDPTLVASPNQVDVGDAAIIEQAAAGVTSLPKPPNIRFTLDLEPAVLLTHSAISSLLTQRLTFNVDISQASTYQQALHDHGSRRLLRPSKQGVQTGHEDGYTAAKRWTRNFMVFDKDGLAKQAHHSYALYSSPLLGVYPMQSFSFEHPRQLAEAIPLLRQYALLWSIMRKLVSSSDQAAVPEHAAKKPKSNERSKKSRAPQKKSNLTAQCARLDAFLTGGGRPGGETDPASSTSSLSEARVAIDVSLNMTLTSPSNPKLDLLFRLPSSADRRAGGREVETPRFGTVSMEIETNGIIRVTSADGLPWTDPETLRKMASVLTLSEDLGILVQWILGRLSTA